MNQQLKEYMERYDSDEYVYRLCRDRANICVFQLLEKSKIIPMTNIKSKDYNAEYADYYCDNCRVVDIVDIDNVGKKIKDIQINYSIDTAKYFYNISPDLLLDIRIIVTKSIEKVYSNCFEVYISELDRSKMTFSIPPITLVYDIHNFPKDKIIIKKWNKEGKLYQTISIENGKLNGIFIHQAIGNWDYLKANFKDDIFDGEILYMDRFEGIIKNNKFTGKYYPPKHNFYPRKCVYMEEGKVIEEWTLE